MRAKLALLFIALLVMGIFVVGCAPEVPENDFDMEDDPAMDDPGGGIGYHDGERETIAWIPGLI